MSINIDINHEVRNAHRELPLTAENARIAVQSLDGDDISDIELESDNYRLNVSCGPDKFWVTYSIPDAEGQPEFYSLVTDREAGEHEVRMVGGTMTDTWACELVPPEAAEKAAVEFAETGRINLTPDWLNNEEMGRVLHAHDDDESQS